MKYTPHTVWVESYFKPAMPDPIQQQQPQKPQQKRWIELRNLLSSIDDPIDIEGIMYHTGWSFNISHYSLGCLRRRGLLRVNHAVKVSPKGAPRALYKCDAE